MLYFVITTKDEVKTLKETLEVIVEDLEKLNEVYEVIVVAPDERTRDFVSALSIHNTKIVFIQDEGRGKPIALNDIFCYIESKKAPEDALLFLSDGDVITEHGAIEAILEKFNDRGLTGLDAIQGKSEKWNKPYCNHTVLSTVAFDAEVRQTRKSYDKKIGAVSGHPIPIDSRATMFGYFAHFLTNAADYWRKKQSAAKQFFVCSGYLYAIRCGIVNHMPENVLGDDRYISEKVYETGWGIGYAENAFVKIKYADNFHDWFLQKVRSAGAYAQTIKRANNNGKKDMSVSKWRNIFTETGTGIYLFFTYPQSVREYLWTIVLYIMRIAMWLLIFWKIKIKHYDFDRLWKRIESTK
ncbi:MAG: glycosyltransferase [Parcubacteria group bacterium]|nr:glycosyltransferase [Parcubacteria group bacterium]